MTLTHWCQDKWSTFCKWHFWIHFLQCKLWQLDSNVIEICSRWSNQHIKLVQTMAWCQNRHASINYLNQCQNMVVFSKTLAPGNTPGPRFNIKMTSYQYRKSHCGDKTILRPSYLHNGISFTGKMTSLYWIRPLLACETEVSEGVSSRVSCQKGPICHA